MFLTGLQPFKELNPCRVTIPKRNSNKKQDVRQTTNEELTCPASFLETFKNITDNDLKDTLKYLSFRKESCQGWNVLFNFSHHKVNMRKRKKISGLFSHDVLNLSGNLLSPQNHSYHSSQSYISNLEKKIVSHVLFSPTSSIPIGFQIRGFKTERGDINKQTGFVNRIRSGIKYGQAKTDAVIENPAATSNRMKNLLQDDSLSLEDKQRMKVAFAEGYLVRDNKQKPSSWFRWLQLLAAIVIIHALFLYVLVNSSNPMLRLPKNEVEVDAEDIKVTFNDVKGADEAKQELKDVVQFLKNPEKFTTLGAKLPRGVLLVGPPGTGKTLLARAVAGEAGVPFFHTSGPEFDEVLVGQGARRVRDLFKSAKEKAPCVVFIDEIDSVGSKRTNSVLHPYANQTINQLLTEMDGFQQTEGVIVLGATNRKEELDSALLRPGRFDIEVNVPVPDISGRKDILSLYLSHIKCSRGIDVDVLARGTTGFTGADIHNMVNQAALRAAIDGLTSVNMKYLENARDKVLMGPERKSRIPDEEANTITAYHESGHAVVAYFTKGSNPLHKVTIMPRGQSLGHTAYIPEKEMYHVTKSQLLAMVDTMMGGRAAEEIIFGPDKITSGASSDLKQATSIATRMVKEWGMSEKAGLRTYPSNEASIINDLGHHAAEKIDSEIQRLLQESYARAKGILEAHRLEHKLLAEALLKYETLDASDIKAIMNSKNPLPPPPAMLT